MAHLLAIVTGSFGASGQGQARLGGRIQEGSPAADALPPSGPNRHVPVSGRLRSPAEPRSPGESQRRRRQDESQEPLPREQPRAAEEAVGGRPTTESGHVTCHSRQTIEYGHGRSVWSVIPVERMGFHSNYIVSKFCSTL